MTACFAAEFGDDWKVSATASPTLDAGTETDLLVGGEQLPTTTSALPDALVGQ